MTRRHAPIRAMALSPVLPLVVAAVASGCGGDGGPAPGDPDAAASSEPDAASGTGEGRSAGCDTAPAASGVWTFELGDRTATISLPDDYDPAVAYPLILGFHGGGDTGDNFRMWSGVEPGAGGDAIYVYPTGPDGVWNAEVYDGDFAFVEAAVDAVLAGYCVDPRAVFAFGFSWGGWAVTQLACVAPDRIAGVASIAGGGPMGECAGPVAVMLIHGTADGAEPISSSEAARDHFEALDGCTGDPAPVGSAGCVARPACTEPVVWCQHDGDHGIPGFAPAEIWAFFDSLR